MSHMKHSAKLPETLLRDQLISTTEGIIEDAWDDLNGRWLGPANRDSFQARVDEVQPILRKLYDAEDDGAARVIIAEIPYLALTEAGIATSAGSIA